MTLATVVLVYGVAALLLLLANSAAIWWVARLFRVNGFRKRRALGACGLFFLVTATLGIACLLVEDGAPPDESMSPWELLCGFAIVVLFVKLALRLSFLRSFAPSLVFFVLHGGFALAIFLPLRAFVAEAFEIPTNSMALTLFGPHVRVTCGQCGRSMEVGATLDPRSPSMANRGLPWPAAKAIPCASCEKPISIAEDTTVFAGDHILVDKTTLPGRWDLCVFRYPQDPSVLYVDRLIGLPGERIDIANGEVFINGKIAQKPFGVAHELWIPVHDTMEDNERTSTARGWKPEREGSVWMRAGAGWSVEGGGLGSERLVYAGPLDDRLPYNAPSSFGASGKDQNAGDVEIVCDLLRWSGTGALGFDWERGSVSVHAAARASGELEIASGDSRSTAKGRPFAESGRLLFCLRDGRARLAAQCSETVAVELPDVGPQTLEEHRTRFAGDAALRIAVTASQGRAEIARITLRRDVHYREAGSVRGVALGAGEHFVLGDNSRSSADSRYWGPVPAAYVVGVVRWIVFPFHRWESFPPKSL